MKNVLTLAALGILGLAGPAGAQAISTFGEGRAYACFRAADGASATVTDVAVCTAALDQDFLAAKERAATYVNRGVLHLRRRDAAAAGADFDAALVIDPELPEALVNRGAALILLGDDAGAESAITQGLTLGPSQAHEAHYNRAFARERQGNFKGAYEDFKAALALKPEWTEAQTELARFKVSRPGA